MVKSKRYARNSADTYRSRYLLAHAGGIVLLIVSTCEGLESALSLRSGVTVLNKEHGDECASCEECRIGEEDEPAELIDK